MRHHEGVDGAATETEVKIRIGDPERMRTKIQECGFRVSVARLFEANTLLDTEKLELRKAGNVLRLRQAGESGVLTFKGAGSSSGGRHKSREELETSVGCVETLRRVMDRLGFRPAFRYEKYRTEFREAAGGDGVVTLDETPIGNFLEIEGAGDWIDKTASRLGFSEADYIVESYGRLYLDDCKRRGIQPTNMVFA